jgi:hypothetical protein
LIAAVVAIVLFSAFYFRYLSLRLANGSFPIWLLEFNHVREAI